jgi:putative iron-dependent peroxidase
MSTLGQDNAIGRWRDNVKLDAAPNFPHVERTVQESFFPESFVLRRSRPWVVGRRAGLMFVYFGRLV